MGLADTVVTGGFESLSNAPFMNLQMRKGNLFGIASMVDSI